MRVLIQRVSKAGVTANGALTGSIGKGLVVLAGFESTDDRNDIEWITKKILALRIFDDEQKVPNLSVTDTRSEILVVSQFTLFASTKKGNRPGYSRAAPPDIAIPLYETFLQLLQEGLGRDVAKGIFGADMQVELVNDGPVTIWIDSKAKE